MAGLVPSVLGSRVFAFLLFIMLVWIAVDLGKVINGVAGGKLPGHVRTLIDPNGAPANEQTKL